MSATIRLGGTEAVISNYTWTGEHAVFVQLRNAMLDPHGPSGADPNPDLHAAQAAVEVLGGKVVRFDPTDYEEGVVY